MSTVALSPRINLEQSRKQAKGLVKAFKAGEPETLDHIRWHHPRFRGLTDGEIRKRKFILADAIIAGDISKLRALLRDNPELMRERSTREHHAPLVHFISANGVEGYRQISPPNIVEVAKVLLDAGAEVDAESEAYGGGSNALGLVATSTPPRLARELTASSKRLLWARWIS